MSRLLILLVAALASCNLGASEIATHCKKNEEVHFNCQVENSNKIGSLCISRSNNETRKVIYVQYRFGKIGAIEFVFPKTTSQKDQINRFHADSGITKDKSFKLSEVSFRNGQWNYRLAYFEDDPRSNNPKQESIIQVWKTNEKFESKKVFTCANPDAGEELDLMWLLKDISTDDFDYTGSLW